MEVMATRQVANPVIAAELVEANAAFGHGDWRAGSAKREGREPVQQFRCNPTLLWRHESLAEALQCTRGQQGTQEERKIRTEQRGARERQGLARHSWQVQGPKATAWGCHGLPEEAEGVPDSEEPGEQARVPRRLAPEQIQHRAVHAPLAALEDTHELAAPPLCTNEQGQPERRDKDGENSEEH